MISIEAQYPGVTHQVETWGILHVGPSYKPDGVDYILRVPNTDKPGQIDQEIISQRRIERV